MGAEMSLDLPVRSAGHGRGSWSLMDWIAVGAAIVVLALLVTNYVSPEHAAPPAHGDHATAGHDGPEAGRCDAVDR